MERTNNSFVNIDTEVQASDDVINFASPLAITDNTRQWNMTKYDINSLDINDYDGVVTINHGQTISDVVGKVINLRKDLASNKILIDGIKFAVNSNPIAILAKNLMKDGFVSGVSIETIGGDPDETGTWRNHKLSGLSIVAHPNNKNAYAVIKNSIKEAKSYGLKTNSLEPVEEIRISTFNDSDFIIQENYGVIGTSISSETQELKERVEKLESSSKTLKNSTVSSLLASSQIVADSVKETSSKLNSIIFSFNGGKGSGNHNPGQGRGMGKPNGGGSHSLSSSRTKKDSDIITDNSGYSISRETFRKSSKDVKSELIERTEGDIKVVKDGNSYYTADGTKFDVKEEAESYRLGQLAALKFAEDFRKTEPVKDKNGKYKVVYKGTDFDIGENSYYDKAEHAYFHSDGYNKTVDKIKEKSKKS